MGPGKNQTNIQKHGLDFADAGEIFSMPMLVALDDREGYGEDRWIGIGMLKTLVVVVVYVERDEDTLRIISLRRRFRMNARNMNESSKTDWDRIGVMSDEAINTSDIPPLSKAFFEKAALRAPRRSVAVTVHVDPDVLAWFQAQGQDYEQRLNAALRIYAEAHQP